MRQNIWQDFFPGKLNLHMYYIFFFLWGPRTLYLYPNWKTTITFAKRLCNCCSHLHVKDNFSYTNNVKPDLREPENDENYCLSITSKHRVRYLNMISIILCVVITTRQMRFGRGLFKALEETQCANRCLMWIEQIRIRSLLHPLHQISQNERKQRHKRQ